MQYRIDSLPSRRHGVRWRWEEGGGIAILPELIQREDVFLSNGRSSPPRGSSDPQRQPTRLIILYGENEAASLREKEGRNRKVEEGRRGREGPAQLGGTLAFTTPQPPPPPPPRPLRQLNLQTSPNQRVERGESAHPKLGSCCHATALRAPSRKRHSEFRKSLIQHYFVNLGFGRRWLSGERRTESGSKDRSKMDIYENGQDR